MLEGDRIMERLYVLYDDHCGLCRWARRWAMSQPKFMDLVFIAAGSEEAKRRFPSLSNPGAPEELIAAGDDGSVYRGSSAWIMCLYALEDYREWSLRLGRPLLRPLARAAFSLVSTERGRLSRWLRLADQDVAARLRQVATECALEPAGKRDAPHTVFALSGRPAGDDPCSMESAEERPEIENAHSHTHFS